MEGQGHKVLLQGFRDRGDVFGTDYNGVCIGCNEGKVPIRG